VLGVKQKLKFKVAFYGGGLGHPRSQFMNRFFPRILSILTRFFPRILSIRTDSLYVFGECAQIILNIQNGIIFNKAFKGILLKKVCTVCVQLDQRPTRNNRLFGPSLTKKILSAYSDNMWNDLQIRISRQI
jgi:hypothetical protein